MGLSSQAGGPEPRSVLLRNIQKLTPSSGLFWLPPAIPDVLASLLFSDSRNQEPGLGASRTRKSWQFLRSPINPVFINGISLYLRSEYESLGIKGGLASPHGLKIEGSISQWVKAWPPESCPDSTAA